MVPFVVAALLTACTLPARSSADYEDDAVATAQTAISHAGTALLTARAVDGGGLLPPTVAVLLRDAEEGIGATRSIFASIQPPNAASDALREELLSLLDPTAHVMSEMRIAARRDDADRIVSLSDELERRYDDLDAFVQERGPA